MSEIFTYLGAANITSKQKFDMTKVAIKNENITSFGGIYHIMDIFSKLGFERLTESVLGKRGSSGKAFCYGSILGSLFFSYLCGGECLEDINVLIGQFRQRPDTLLPGADTVGRGLKELAEKNIVYKSETSDKSYSFNTAQKLNTLLLRMIRRMGLIKVGSHVDLDFDHQFIPAHKFDAKYSYKQDFGYFPGWASIGGIIVGGENRDGNTNVRFHQEDTLHRVMDRVTSELGVVIERFRADCGSFSKEIIQTVEQRMTYHVVKKGNQVLDFEHRDAWGSPPRCPSSSVPTALTMKSSSRRSTSIWRWKQSFVLQTLNKLIKKSSNFL